MPRFGSAPAALAGIADRFRTRMARSCAMRAAEVCKNHPSHGSRARTSGDGSGGCQPVPAPCVPFLNLSRVDSMILSLPKTLRFASFHRAMLACALTAGLVGASGPAAAQSSAGARIGVVSIERIMRDSAPAKAAQAKIEKDFSRRDKEIQDLGARLRAASERFEKDSTVMADAERGRRQRELSDMDRDFQRRQREFREDLNQRRNEELTAVLDKANRAIKSIAEHEKFDLILQDAVYVSPRLDITDTVIRQLNSSR